MNTRDMLTITGTALVTAALALTILRPSLVDAGSDGLSAKIDNPRLMESDVEFTLTALRLYTEGEQPEFELTGVNTTGESAAITVESSMNALAGPVMTMPDGVLRSMSRMMPRPQELFRQRHILMFGPHESRKVRITSTTALPGPSLVSVFLQAVNDGNARNSQPVRMLSFATERPAPARTVRATSEN